MLLNRVHLATVDSTNAWAKRALRGGPGGPLDASRVLALTASEQTAGRGRGSRTWASSLDDIKLTLAFALPPAVVPRAYLLSAIAAVASVRACARVLPPPPAAARVGVKWPNDIIVGGWRKVGGILCELETESRSSEGGEPRYWAIVGIGINVNSSPDTLPPRLHWPATTLHAEAGRDIDAEALTGSLIDSFLECLRVFLERGFAPFISEYRGLSVLIGRRVSLHTSADTAPSQGVVVDHGEDGALVVRLDGGATDARFLSGEVTRLELEGGQAAAGERPPDED